jgi:beta-lactamase regulating signal transducer with metallopeptidase domain
MQSFLVYILLSSGCLSVAYLFYKALLEKKTRLQTIRFYFLTAVVISLLAPFSPWSIRTPVDVITPGSMINYTAQAKTNSGVKDGPVTSQTRVAAKNEWRIIPLLCNVYLSITLFFILRLIRELIAIFMCYRKATKEKRGQLQLVWNHWYKGSFSFFHLIFLNKKYLSNDDLEKVLAHEKAHALQVHSADLLLMQLLTAFMWFNPLIWAMRNAVQLIHEYLADEAVLNTGIDKVQYQQSLLDHVTESAMISISSTFKYSLLKKRFLMMSAEKTAPATRFRILVLLPATAMMLLGVACANGQAVTNAPKVVTAVALTNANVLYVGIDNPVNISVSGYTADAIRVAIDNGTIMGDSGEYVIHVAKPGKAVVTVQAGGKVVQQTAFVAKFLSPPVVALKPAPGSQLIKGGPITKGALLAAGGIVTMVENADIDIRIKVVSFAVSVITNSNEQQTSEASSSGVFTNAQVKLIQSLKKGQKVIIDEIAAAGPDGKAMKVPASMVFTIED